MKIIYPDYMPNWSGSRGRLYPSKEEILKTNPQIKGMTDQQRKLMQRHYIDLDRMNADPKNIHLLDAETHEGVHKQERALSSALIKAGIIGYDRENPHYFIADGKVRRVLEKMFKGEVR
jgi:hypothetical protein